jgi:hypothetical protein
MAKKIKNPDWDIPYCCKHEKRPNTGNITTKLFIDLQDSEAYNDMTVTARMIYVYMSEQKHKIPISKKPYNRIDLFTFPISLWLDKYHLCSNNKQFNKFCDELIEHGFIEVYENGKNTRTPNVYKYSCNWQTWEIGTDFRPPDIRKRSAKQKLLIYTQDMVILFKKWRDWLVTSKNFTNVIYS